MRYSKHITLAILLLLGATQSAYAFKIGPRTGLYYESFDDGQCYQEHEIGLFTYLNFDPGYKKECRRGNCGGGMMMPVPMPVPMPMPMMPMGGYGSYGGYR